MSFHLIRLFQDFRPLRKRWPFPAFLSPFFLWKLVLPVLAGGVVLVGWQNSQAAEDRSVISSLSHMDADTPLALHADPLFHGTVSGGDCDALPLCCAVEGIGVLEDNPLPMSVVPEPKAIVTATILLFGLLVYNVRSRP